MKIWQVDETGIEFYDGMKITSYHHADCCEQNYADYEQLDDLAKSYDFKFPLKFETVDGSGFRFGDEKRMFFVPCYSEQNGYYSSEITILLDGREKLSFDAQFVYA